MRTSGEVTIHIKASADRIYALVADVSRIGEFSPECRRADWVGDVREAAPGARFRGRNVASRLLRWSRTCEVLAADPGREFAFRTIPVRRYPDSTVWRYRFHPVGDGTDVTESYQLTRLPPRPLIAVYRRLLPHHMDMRPHIRRTLEAIKLAMETDAGTPSAGPGAADSAAADGHR